MPCVSVIMCNYNCAPFIDAAIVSALAQEGAQEEGQGPLDLELIVIDDASQDDSAPRLRRWAGADPRLRLIETPGNLGPAGARNLGIAAAQGRWIAIQDSDDLMAPGRLARLIALAEAQGADIVADDLLAFDDAGLAPSYRLVNGYWGEAPHEVPLARYIESNGLYGRRPGLGYLKPLFRAGLFVQTRYDPRLRIAEDYDLVARMMAAGARMVISSEPDYLYRRRAGSISHRLDPEAVAAMRAADARMRAQFPGLAPGVRAALDRRLASLGRAEGYGRMVAALKRRDAGGFLALAAQSPGALALLRLPLQARLTRLGRRLAARLFPQPGLPPADGRNILFLSRQRIIGATNGSSGYALGIAGALKEAGFRLHYLCPSPLVFGSWPLLTLRPEMALFESVTIRGGWRIGRRIFAADLRILLRAAGRGLELLALRARLLRRPWLGTAPYAIGAPLGPQDKLFLSRHGPARADLILCDYGFLTPAIPWVLRPQAGSMVLMHDLFSSRAAQFARLGGADSVAALGEAEEMRLLGGAQKVIAIQREEAAVVARHLGGDRVLTAPMAIPMAGLASGGAQPVEPAPGASPRILFVGSRTAANGDAMAWFLGEIWPRVRAARPEVVFEVAGTVGRMVKAPPAGVRLLGLVPDLGPLYAGAALVVLPLRAGSGLKIKLVEALALGKAIIATPASCQGIESEVSGALALADTAGAFAQQILRLLEDPEARRALSAAALSAAQRHFSAGACYGGVVDYALACRSGAGGG